MTKRARPGQPAAASPSESLSPAEAGGPPGNSRLPGFVPEDVAISELHAHPKNYRKHPEEQLAHIEASIRQHGFYRNVVVARDGTILAGHGVVLAAKKAGLTHVSVVRLDVDPDSPAALKLLTGDNEISRLGEIDDRALTDLLAEIKGSDPIGLLGTGFDDSMLAAYVMTTRPSAEIKDFNAAAAWTGMPEFDAGELRYVLTVSFPNEAERVKFMAERDIDIKHARQFKGGKVLSMTYPLDTVSVRETVEFVTLVAEQA